LGMGFLKLQLPEERPSRSLQDKGSQAGVWEPAKTHLLIPKLQLGMLLYKL